MNFSKTALTATALATMVGCASGPPPKTQEEIANAYYGSAPSQSQCQRLAQSSVAGQLKDPYSAQYQFTTCSRNYLNNYGTYYFGYHIGGLVNAKNGFGGYVGETRFDVIIQDGVVIARCITEGGQETGCKGAWEWKVDNRYGK